MSVVIVCWVTEAVPYFVTAIFIPVLTVLLQILADDTTHKVLAADAASKVVFSKIFDHSVALVLGGAPAIVLCLIGVASCLVFDCLSVWLVGIYASKF